jgi:hypothetical protein
LGRINDLATDLAGLSLAEDVKAKCLLLETEVNAKKSEFDNVQRCIMTVEAGEQMELGAKNPNFAKAGAWKGSEPHADTRGAKRGGFVCVPRSETEPRGHAHDGKPFPVDPQPAALPPEPEETGVPGFGCL